MSKQARVGHVSDDLFTGQKASRSKTSPRTPENPSPFRIAVTLSLLFDLKEESLFREKNGMQKYFAFMRSNSEQPLKLGAISSFVSKLMSFNSARETRVSLTVLDKVSGPMAKRVLCSLPSLNIGKESGNNAFSFLPDNTFPQAVTKTNCLFDLVLSPHQPFVHKALSNGVPAGHIDPAQKPSNGGERDLRASFDFDRCIGIALQRPGDPDFHLDTDERTKRSVKGPYDDPGISLVQKKEEALMDIPAHPGPLHAAFGKLIALREQARKDPLLPDVHVSIVTARTNGSLARAVATLEKQGLEPDDIVSTGWTPKGHFVKKINSDVFFDDSRKHVASVQKHSPSTLSVHIPWKDEHIRRIVERHNACAMAYTP